MSQSSTGLATPLTDTISDENKQASVGGFRPVAPTWFLDNVRTLDELQQLDLCLELVNDTPPDVQESKSSLDEKSKSTNDHFGIDRLAIEDVLDMTAALHNMPMSAASENGIVLLSKMRFGYDFLDRVVVTMAREVGSSIISLTSSELEDIAADFLRQRNLYLKEHSEHSHEDGNDSKKLISDATEYFFGNQSRRQAEQSAPDRNAQAIFALLDATTARMKADESMNPEVMTPSIILYVRDMLFDAPTLERRILCRIRDAISQRRQAGQRVTLVVGLAHTGADEDATATDEQAGVLWFKSSYSCHLCEYENGECCDEYRCTLKTVRRKLTDQDMSCFVLEPQSVPKEWPKQRVQSWPPPLVAANMQSLKRYLRQNLPRISSHPPDLLEAQSDWTTSFPGDKLKYFFSGAQEETSVVKRIARTYAVGRGLRQRSMCMSDVEAAFARAELAARSRGLLKSHPTVTEESSDDEEGTKSTWRQRIAAILPRCNAQEQALLSNVVDPESLEGTQDEIEADEGILENLSRLVSPTATSTASALSQNSRINGALLYGPPGTGKTLLARVLAKKTGIPMITLDVSNVYSRWLGETEKAIAAAFSLGQKLSPCIVFVDEVDALFFRRSDNDSVWHRQALNQFLQSMDTAAMMRILVEKKPSTNDIAEQGSDDSSSSSSSSGDHDDPPKLEGEDHVESKILNPPPQGDDQTQIVFETATEKVEAGRETDVHGWEIEVDVRCDTEQHQRDEKDQKTTESEMIETSRGPRKQDISVDSLSDQSSKPVALPVLQPPPGCLNRPRKVYPYESLPTDNSIRLLRVELQQSSGSNNLREPVRCSLHVVHLRDQPDYFALSYTWGDPRTIHTRKEDVLSDQHWRASTFEIDCDGNPVSVSTNLYTAIVSLRVHFATGSLATQYGEKYTPQGQDHFFIWVDAICINQDNLCEKGQQISIMSQIYGDCRCVLMWLGGNEPLIGQGWATTRETFDRVIDILGRSEKGRIRRALSKKFDISDEGSYLDLGLEAPTTEQLLGWIRMIYEITIDIFRSLQCSDPRDKVYAFHGMFRHEDGSAVFSTPDYNKTVAEVYLEASKVVFEQIGIRILCKRETRYDLPSELPTWTLDLRMEDEYLFNARAKHYKASRGMGKQDEAALRGSNMVVNGYQIDTVHRASVWPSKSHDSQATFAELLDVLSCLPEKTHIAARASTSRQMISDSGMYPQERSEVLWRTLLFDQSEAQYPIPTRFGAELRAILQEKLQKTMAHLVKAVVHELLLPLAKKTEDIVADSTCTRPNLGDIGYDRLCETCGLRAELSLMLKNQGVTVPDPSVAANEVLDCFSAISKLNGDTPIKSSERLEPPSWHEYLALVDELRTAVAEEENLRPVASKLGALRDFVHSIVSEPTASAHLGDRVLFATSEGRLGVSCGPIRTGDGIWLLAGLQYPVLLREAMDGTHFVVQCAYVHGVMHGEAVPVDEPPVLVELA
ncbi:hypothetical protein FGRMN_8357 [Fusarium graminum]|nr:hypothetical protein FGRMN_8357 [Fusarium graminum]